MSRVPGWIGRLGARLTDVGERLDERRAEVEREEAEADPAPRPRRKPSKPVSAASREPVVLVPRPDPAQAVPWSELGIFCAPSTKSASSPPATLR